MRIFLSVYFQKFQKIVFLGYYLFVGGTSFSQKYFFDVKLLLEIIKKIKISRCRVPLSHRPTKQLLPAPLRHERRLGRVS